MNPPIQCAVQDHVEHVCVLRLPVEIQLKSGVLLRGQAVDLLRHQGDETLHLRTSDGLKTVPLTDIAALKYPEPGASPSVDSEHWRLVPFA